MVLLNIVFYQYLVPSGTFLDYFFVFYVVPTGQKAGVE
ncbi:hypothetical protein C8C83_0327 [Flavobacterium sp. 90]|nr:hypothetical protein C8C82_0622 [Flavobacterium sp. 81]TCK52529.1 hypothetical protein C8C83_0327 [Flavobacterium sp. 90]